MANNAKQKTELSTLKNFNMYDEVHKTKITFEVNGTSVSWEDDRDDHSFEDILNGFMGLAIAQTWLPITILEEMRDFANEHLELLKRNELS